MTDFPKTYIIIWIIIYIVGKSTLCSFKIGHTPDNQNISQCILSSVPLIGGLGKTELLYEFILWRILLWSLPMILFIKWWYNDLKILSNIPVWWRIFGYIIIPIIVGIEFLFYRISKLY